MNSFKLFADYNHWMNQRLYQKVSDLTELQRQEDRGAYFKSIHATLDHIVLADKIWLSRFSNHTPQFHSLKNYTDLKFPAGLNQRVHESWDGLHRERIVLDKDIIDFSSELAGIDLDEPFSYCSTEGDLHERAIGPLLHHFFNHQTHHRGQVTTLLNQLGIDMGVTDLSYLPNS